MPDEGSAFLPIRNLSNTVSHPRGPESYILPVARVILYRKIRKDHTEKDYNVCTQREKIHVLGDLTFRQPKFVYVNARKTNTPTNSF